MASSYQWRLVLALLGAHAAILLRMDAASVEWGPAIGQLRNLQLATELAHGGQASVRVATPADPAWRQWGEFVREALARKTGAAIALVDANALSPEDHARSPLILIGNFENNAVIRRLYANHYCFTDAVYPGEGGFEVRTIHRPMGWSVNHVLLGASGPDGAEAAARAFVARLDDQAVLRSETTVRTFTLARLNVSRSVHNHEEKDEAAYERETVDTLRRQLDTGSVLSAMETVSDVGMAYYQTGREVYGRVFRAAMLHYCDSAEPNDDWVLNKRIGGDSDRYFFPLKLFPAWQLVETAPVFSDAERLRITNLLLNITRWLSRLHYFDSTLPGWKRWATPGEIRNNHATFAASSLYAGLEYFRKYYPDLAELKPAYRGLENIFDGQRNSYRPDDNSATYFNYAPNHFLNYLFSRGDWAYMEQGKLRQIADLIGMSVDNRSDLATYGDEIEYKVGFDKGLRLLAKAAWYYRDGQYLWLRDRLARRSQERQSGLEDAYFLNEARSDRPLETNFTYDGWYDGPYNADLERREPTHLLGIKTMPMDEGLYRFAKKYGVGSAIPIGQAFDKLSMRRDFNPQNEYLLMGGFSGALSHSHEDGNAIIRLTWKDRNWLADMHYRRKLVNAHNSLLVLRDWQYRNIPTFTSLDGTADFPDAGLVTTSVKDYNGLDWDRNTLWGKGKYFLFLDHVRVKEPGDYHLRLNWRTLGKVALEGDALIVDQAGEKFAIRGDADSRKLLSEEPSDGRFVIWSPYEYAGDGVVRILSQIRPGPLNAADELTFINLLVPETGDRYEVRRIQPAVAQVLRNGEVESLVGLAAEGARVGRLELQARIFQLEPQKLTLLDGRKLQTSRPLLASETPVSLQIDLTSGEGELIAGEAVTLLLRTGRLWLEGQAIAGSTENADGLRKFSVNKGRHWFRLELDGDWRELAAQVRPPLEPAAKVPAVAPEAGHGFVTSWTGKDVKAMEAADIDGDGETDILLAADRRLALRSAAGREKWSVELPGSIRTLHVRDLDGDGKQEIMVGTEQGFLHVLDWQGKLRWQQDCPYRRGPITAITTVDLEGDGRRQVLAGSQGYVVYAWEADGRLRWRNMTDIPWGGVVAIVPSDYDGDGRKDLLIATGADHGDVFLTGAGKQIWRASGTTLHARAVNLTEGKKDQLLMGGPLETGPLRLVDPANGTTIWNSGIDDDLKAIIPLPVANGNPPGVMVGYAASGLWRFDATGGKRHLRSFPAFVNVVVPVSGPPASPGWFAVGCEDGRVIAIDVEGRTLGIETLPKAVTSMRVFPAGGKTVLAVLQRDGRLDVLHWSGDGR